MITTAGHAHTAQALMAARDHAALMPKPPTEAGPFTLDDAYAVAELTRQQRLARGERQRGWKIGFTNRGIWPRYGVFAPMWAPVWDSTLEMLDGTEAPLSLAGLVQPRLEPEIVFSFARTPALDADLPALAACLAWMAHGVEVVHTHFADWRFAAPDTVADFGLHGRLLVGPRCPVSDGQDAATLDADLAALHLKLHCDGQPVEQGAGSNVLGSPLQALHAWWAAMQQQTPHWTVQAGDVVTTGTLTDAWPLQPGQHWQTTLSDSRLPGLGVQVRA